LKPHAPAQLTGGYGRLTKGAMSLARSTVAVNDISATKIDIINPPESAFSVHGRPDEVTNRHNAAISTVVIPNSHLRFAPDAIKQDGLNLHDANLLKIQVVYGYQMRLPFLDMKVPGMKWIMRNFMIHADQDNWMYYIRGMIPMKATATVRMQSESWQWQEDPLVVRMFDAVYNWILEEINDNGAMGENDNGECSVAPTQQADPVTGLTASQSEVVVSEPDPLSCPYEPENPDEDDHGSCESESGNETGNESES